MLFTTENATKMERNGHRDGKKENSPIPFHLANKAKHKCLTRKIIKVWADEERSFCCEDVTHMVNRAVVCSPFEGSTAYT